MGALFFDLYGQGAYIPFNREYYHLIERYEILQGDFNPNFHTGFKPYRRDHVLQYVDSLQSKQTFGGRVDQFNLNYLTNDSWEFSSFETQDSEKPLWNSLYRKPSDFYHYRDSVFDLHVNPVLYLSGGLEGGMDEFRFRNSRGVEVRGSIDRKVGFYTFLTTTQTVFPSWVEQYAAHNGAVPGEGFWKPYRDNGYGFFSAMGHVSFQLTKHIAAQVGHDRNFVGEGFRSMVLSDFSNPFMFVKINTQLGKFQMTNLWGQMTADIEFDNVGRPTDGRYPQKFFSHHRIGINLGKKLNVGVYESIMANQIDWNYLNPVIFYRWVEHQLGSPDKVMIGTDFKWHPVPGMQFYGQFVLDEFVFNEFFGIDGKNSSRNKHSLQIGYKYINVFKVYNLDLQLEYNQSRPYTYQEKFEYQSFSNYRTPLTHPLGANFRELVGLMRYQPLPRLSLNLTGLYQFFGTDPSETVNFGGDVLKSREIDGTGLGLYGHTIGQGVANDVVMTNINASYMLKHNLFLDFGHYYRWQLTQERVAVEENSHFLHLAVRMNLVRQNFSY